MNTVVNLRLARKKKQRADKEKKAVENRILFGQTKLEKKKRQKEQYDQQKELDGKKLDN